MSATGVARRGLAWSVGLLSLLAVGLLHILWLRFCYDDAFVSFRYAAHLAEGHGLVYNIGERVEGYSNFLWTLLISLGMSAGGDPVVMSQGLGALFALLGLAAVILAAPRVGASPAAAGWIIAANASWATWGTGGLETALFGCAVTVGAITLVLAEDRREPLRWMAGSGLAFGLACLTRPDGILLAAAAGVFVLARVMGRRLPAAALAWWIVPLALCVLPHLLWRRSFYGHWLPNTFAVKEPGMDRFGQGFAYLWSAVSDLRLDLLALPMLVAPFVRERIAAAANIVSRRRTQDERDVPAAPSSAAGRMALLLATMLVPFVVYLASTGGDFMPVYRFVAPLIPLVGIAAAAGLGRIERAAGGGGRRAARSAAWALIGAYVLFNAHGSWRQQSVWSEGEMVSVGWSRQEMDEWLRIGDLLRHAALPSDTLATTGAGAIPFRSRLHTIDLHGLNAPDLGRFRRRDSQRPGHTLMLEGRWLDERPPQILLGHPLVHPTAASLALGVDLEPEWRERVMSHYELLGMRLPGEPVRFVGCAVRQDAVDRLIEAARMAPTGAR